MHRILKRYLKFFIDDLMNVIDKLKLMLTNQYKDYFAQITAAKKDTS